MTFNPPKPVPTTKAAASLVSGVGDASISYLSTKQAHELATRRGVTVYDYVQETPVERNMPAGEVEQLAKEIRAKFEEARAVPGAPLPWQVRRELLTVPQYKEFEGGHQGMFKALTSDLTTPAHLESIYFMIKMKRLVDQGEITGHQAKALIQQYALPRYQLPGGVDVQRFAQLRHEQKREEDGPDAEVEEPVIKVGRGPLPSE